LICGCLQFTPTGLYDYRQRPAEVGFEPQKDDVSDVLGSSQDPHLQCAENADDQLNNSLDSSAVVTATVTEAKDTVIYYSADTNDILASGPPKNAQEIIETGTAETDKCLAPLSGVSDGLNVAESTKRDEADGDKLDTRLAESGKAFVTNNDKSDTAECDEAVAGRMADIHSPPFSADADRPSPVTSVDCADDGRPDSTELHVIVDAAESTVRTAADAQHSCSAAVNSDVSSHGEDTDTLHSLVSQLKLAISSAHSGNRVLCLISFTSLHFNGLIFDYDEFRKNLTKF